MFITIIVSPKIKIKTMWNRFLCSDPYKLSLSVRPEAKGPKGHLTPPQKAWIVPLEKPQNNYLLTGSLR